MMVDSAYALGTLASSIIAQNAGKSSAIVRHNAHVREIANLMSSDPSPTSSLAARNIARSISIGRRLMKHVSESESESKMDDCVSYVVRKMIDQQLFDIKDLTMAHCRYSAYYLDSQHNNQMLIGFINSG